MIMVMVILKTLMTITFKHIDCTSLQLLEALLKQYNDKVRCLALDDDGDNNGSNDQCLPTD